MKVSGRKPGGTNSSTHQRKEKSGTVKINGCDRVDVRDKSLSLRSSEYMFYKENFAGCECVCVCVCVFFFFLLEMHGAKEFL